ncbi:hypothetical protein L202_04968 [Cryptococcus amylolentus CBS 6039]|uniref:Uncharacterized protein n=1 Tax=Cryptococcus amylolentus CBS 6039 TaxID=1295533 RepID=A0A1E3HNE8_9TREE|nr:hypothetical protein L202_04968 [Cryptococcus amylolentus CBS 6039]ODN77854.1 hypothetical protein L202_04968 [Cryptococcus amylolentus CBS 6039]
MINNDTSPAPHNACRDIPVLVPPHDPVIDWNPLGAKITFCIPCEPPQTRSYTHPHGREVADEGLPKCGFLRKVDQPHTPRLAPLSRPAAGVYVKIAESTDLERWSHQVYVGRGTRGGSRYGVEVRAAEHLRGWSSREKSKFNDAVISAPPGAYKLVVFGVLWSDPAKPYTWTPASKARLDSRAKLIEFFWCANLGTIENHPTVDLSPGPRTYVGTNSMIPAEKSCSGVYIKITESTDPKKWEHLVYVGEGTRSGSRFGVDARSAEHMRSLRRGDKNKFNDAVLSAPPGTYKPVVFSVLWSDPAKPHTWTPASKALLDIRANLIEFFWCASLGTIENHPTVDLSPGPRTYVGMNSMIPICESTNFVNNFAKADKLGRFRSVRGQEAVNQRFLEVVKNVKHKPSFSDRPRFEPQAPLKLILRLHKPPILFPLKPHRSVQPQLLDTISRRSIATLPVKGKQVLLPANAS